MDEIDPDDFNTLLVVEVPNRQKQLDAFEARHHPAFGEYSLWQSVEGDDGRYELMNSWFASSIAECVELAARADTDIIKTRLRKALAEVL